MTTPAPPPNERTALRFRAGVVCIFLNYILGWPFLLGVETLAAYQKSTALAIFGTVVYGFSWLLLGVGLWLAGPRALTTVKEGYQRFFPRGKEKKQP